MESKIAYLNVELAAIAEREKKREEERGGDCGSKGGREQEEIFFLHVRLAVMDLIRTVMRMISLIRRVRVMRSGQLKLQQFAASFVEENRPPE
ncbi:hypothetical protein H5410_003802, partial [Solanum commersonii]